MVASELTKRYGAGETEVVALDGVSTAFDRDRFTAIMGPSGSGKSTLMHILAGLDTPSSGTVTLDGIDITHLDDGELTKLRRDKLGFVFQFFNLLPVLTAEENLVLPLSIAGRKPDQQWVDQLIRTVGLEDRRTHRPTSSPAASSSGSRWRGRWSRNRRSSSPTSRPATSTRRRAPTCSTCCAALSTTSTRPW